MWGFLTEHLTCCESAPLFCPSKESASPRQVSLDRERFQSQKDGAALLTAYCNRCQSSGSLDTVRLHAFYGQTFFGPPQAPLLAHALVLCDCANTIPAPRRAIPRDKDRPMRIISSHIRDLQCFTRLTFLRTPFNLAGAGTKSQSNINAWKLFISTGRFKLCFMSRKGCKAVLNSEKKDDPANYRSVAPSEGLNRCPRVKKGDITDL